MPGPRVDPSDYARQRQESIARANEMRATRRNRGGGGDAAGGGGDSLGELAGGRRTRRSPRASGRGARSRPAGPCTRTRRRASPTTTTRAPEGVGQAAGCAGGVENAPLRENGAVSQPRSTPGRRDLPRDMTEPRSTARAEPRTPMSEAEFEGWLGVLKRRSLTGSQARRVSTLLQRYSGHAATDADAAYGYGSSRWHVGETGSDSLSNLKLSMRSKRNKDPSDAELRTRSASERCCPKCAPKKARKTFNAAAHRADGFDGDEKQMVKKAAAEVKKELRRKERDGAAAAPGGKDKKWKAQSNQLREAMQAMRGVAAAEKAGKPPPPMVASAPDRPDTNIEAVVGSVSTWYPNAVKHGTIASFAERGIRDHSSSDACVSAW
ncbi:hypothetical protein JL720_12930 [Aureococcus anophagefferens]|nr:hypothetical protein JL720_12930 [Aureococcus anophagefferens]